MSLKSNSFVAVAEKYVFSLFLNSDEADVTSLGRPFHTFAPTTVFLYTGRLQLLEILEVSWNLVDAPGKIF